MTTTYVFCRTWEWITLINIYMWYCLANLAGNTTFFLYVLTYLNIWQFWKYTNQNFWKHYMATIASSWKEIMMKKQHMFLSLDIISMKWYNYIYWSRNHFIFIVCERQEKLGFRQWAWVMVLKRRRAPVNVRTSCMSANERSKARLSVVQPRQSVWLPY